MSEAIKPIETPYRGVRFRSRLEARWAVYFDAFEIPWEYEPERYRLKDGRIYIPDFRLDGRVLVEVKPPGGSFEKAAAFDGRIILLEGPPSLDRLAHPVWHVHEEDPECEDLRLPECRRERCSRTCPGFAHDEVFVGCGHSDRFFYWAWGGDVDPWTDLDTVDIRFRCAVSQALSARFGAYDSNESRAAETRESRAAATRERIRRYIRKGDLDGLRREQEAAYAAADKLKRGKP